ncbi:MAG: hypothetical protein K5866_06945 [Treponema sp.]|nr:hypothetical protein [Treponema sp.]
MSKIKEILLVLLQALLISFIVIIAVLPVSCKITESGIQLVGGDYSPPELVSFTVLDEKRLLVNFSEAVDFTDLVLSPRIPGFSDSEESSENLNLSESIAAALGSAGAISVSYVASEDLKSYTFEFEEETQVGKAYEFYACVVDKIGNSLNLAIPFTGYNSRVPKIMMTEVHAKMAAQKSEEIENDFRRLEYVEFLVLEDGNLVGLEFVSGKAGEDKKYVFPAVEVHKGEIFLLHLRSKGNGCVSEEGDDLTLATNTYSSPEYRDLWLLKDEKFTDYTTDILVVRDSVSNKIIDAFMYRAEDVDNWSTKLKTDFSLNADICEIYESGDTENATLTTGLSETRYLIRNGTDLIYQKLLNGESVDFHVKADSQSWYISKENSPGRV